MFDKIAAHSRVDVIGVHREAAFAEEARIDARSRAEIEQGRAGCGDARDEFPVARARAPVGLVRRDLADVLRAGWGAPQMSQVRVFGCGGHQIPSSSSR